MKYEKTLGIADCSEPFHLTLLFASRAVRGFKPIVGVLRGFVRSVGDLFTMRDAIAAYLVGDQPIWGRLLLQQFAEESLRGGAVPTFLYENVNDVAVLVDGTLEIVTLTLDQHEDLVEVPDVTATWPLTLQLPRETRTKA
ncbi:MAG: hypothetical protein AAF493_18595 [Pseudomonadota bacterium]